MSLSRVKSITIYWRLRDQRNENQATYKTWAEAETAWRQLSEVARTLDGVWVRATWVNGLRSLPIPCTTYHQPSIAAFRDALAGSLYKFFHGSISERAHPRLVSARASNMRQMLLRCAFDDSVDPSEDAAFADVARAVREQFPDRADEILRRVERWRAASERPEEG